MTAVIAGCGDLGTRVGLRLAEAGHRVIGIRRPTELLPDDIEELSVDLRSERPDLPADTRLIVIALTADRRTEACYRATFLDGISNLISALPRGVDRRTSTLLVSSTGVYGDAGGAWVDESTPARPESTTAEVLLRAEQLLSRRAPQPIILRLAGLYGPGRGTLVERVRTGSVTAPPNRVYSNRIHIDDAAAAIVHLLTQVQRPDSLYIGADDEPVDRRDLLDFIADRLQVPRPAVDIGPTAGGGKRCRNDRLRAAGIALRYPTYREGYTALLD